MQIFFSAFIDCYQTNLKMIYNICIVYKKSIRVYPKKFTYPEIKLLVMSKTQGRWNVSCFMYHALCILEVKYNDICNLNWAEVVRKYML